MHLLSLVAGAYHFKVLIAINKQLFKSAQKVNMKNIYGSFKRQ